MRLSNYIIGERCMKIQTIKTVYGQKPMQICDAVSVCDNAEREGELISIFPDIEYQEIKGFGGAFTEAASTTLDKLSKKNREKILKLYFDKEEGIGYNFGRVHINSCDFSLGNYAYTVQGDDTLETFDISRDKNSLIPMIKEAMSYNEIEMFASPWSPPAYMKTNGQMNYGAKLVIQAFVGKCKCRLLSGNGFLSKSWRKYGDFVG